MGVYEGRGQLTKAMKELANRWIEIKGIWNDAVAGNFESRFIVPLEMELRNATGAMDHIAQLLQKIHQDCE